jgi:hypothetical protein
MRNYQGIIKIMFKLFYTSITYSDIMIEYSTNLFLPHNLN